MIHYRVYCFDGASRIVGADWVEAPDDLQALIAARNAFDCFRVEVWERDRLAGRHERGEHLRTNVSADVSFPPKPTPKGQ